MLLKCSNRNKSDPFGTEAWRYYQDQQVLLPIQGILLENISNNAGPECNQGKECPKECESLQLHKHKNQNMSSYFHD